MNIWHDAETKWRWLEENTGKEAGGGNTEGEQTGEKTGQQQQEPSVDDLLAGLPDSVKAHYGKLIGTARKEGRDAAKAEADAAKTAAEEAAALEVAKKAGDFEKVETTLKGQLADLTADRDKKQKRLDDLNEALGGRIEELKKGMSDVQLEGYPEDGDALDQITFLEKRKAWLEKLGTAGERQRGTNNTTPDRTSRTTGNIQQQELERIQRNGSYTV